MNGLGVDGVIGGGGMYGLNETGALPANGEMVVDENAFMSFKSGNGVGVVNLELKFDDAEDEKGTGEEDGKGRGAEVCCDTTE